ncbi:LPS export ABC transporter periplasmic protein LptC [Candidatus Berkiella aquae]|uniref:LPS export ABC transporter periplasmic protein LptC n=1 Tax=Candidatus Berkiella aquae TaxID=295108 RepID=A0A0Q9YX14_9GAMM|nr:LPS export ABC transporter periplasmic protein LptC [Candidatus Berkiella aquae]MCS5710731.1 LPS export ABC transporter periplasmic protein LptC [Candidatus Berkiella aquae]
MFHRTTLYPLLFIAALVAAMYFFNFFSPSDIAVKSNEQNSDVLEETMTGVSAKRYDKNGKLIQVLEMGSWSHFKGQTTTQMLQPHLTVYQDNGSCLTVSSAQGEGYQAKMGTQIDQLKLINNVNVKQMNPKTQSWWELKTSSLLLFPKDPNPRALTDDKVTVYAPSLTIEAQGMRADLHRETVEFLHQVKTFYETPH